MFFAGVQLISLGVIGEYLGRVYEEVKGRPLFLVAEELGLDAHSSPADRRATASAVSGRASAEMMRPACSSFAPTTMP